ncbi:MAG: ParB/RepB/Spo0J family partition protein [Pyrinomonadaceae bacterium]|nr:ParB/RepB/Spo0J family partition protein [Pyrinomonadaceae bacterium]
MKKALGRGLSALMPEQTNSREELVELAIDQIEPNREQPRTKFTTENLEELAQSIRENGIIQPIIVRRVGSKFQIVAGERRWRATQLTKIEKIPAIIRDVSDEKLLEIALIENIQRQELNPIEEAKAYKKLIETLGLTQEMVAQRVGKDRTFITNYLRLLRLPESILNLVDEEKISVGHARALLSVEDVNIQQKIARNIITMGLSVRETERAIKRLSSEGEVESAVVKKPQKNNANVLAAEDKLRRRFGTKTKIVQNSKGKGGKIEIAFYDSSDLDRIYKMMINNDNSIIN